MKNKYYPVISIEQVGRWSLLLFMSLTLSGTAACQNSISDIDWLIDVLEIEEGSVVADVGAGDGEQTLALVRRVGSSGHIYSTELGSEVENLRQAVSDSEAENITVVEGAPAQTNLPSGCCDAIFMRRVYHHFSDPETMNKSLWESLKPGGKVAVIDFEPRGSESKDPDGRDSGSQHGVSAETVIGEMSRVGFSLVKNEKRNGRNIYIVMKKPSGG